MRLFWLLQLLLVGLSYGQDVKTLVSGTEAAANPAAADPAAADPATTDSGAGTTTNATAEDKQRFPRPDEVIIIAIGTLPFRIIGQSTGLKVRV